MFSNKSVFHHFFTKCFVDFSKCCPLHKFRISVYSRQELTLWHDPCKVNIRFSDSWKSPDFRIIATWEHSLFLLPHIISVEELSWQDRSAVFSQVGLLWHSVDIARSVCYRGQRISIAGLRESIWLWAINAGIKWAPCQNIFPINMYYLYYPITNNYCVFQVLCIFILWKICFSVCIQG